MQTKTHILNGLAYFEILCCEKQCKLNSSFLRETKNGSHPFAEYQEDDNLGSFKFWIQHKVERKSLKRNLCRSTQESYYKFRNTLPSLHTTSKESCCFKTKSGILLLEIFHSERHIHEKYWVGIFPRSEIIAFWRVKDNAVIQPKKLSQHKNFVMGMG